MRLIFLIFALITSTSCVQEVEPVKEDFTAPVAETPKPIDAPIPEVKLLISNIKILDIKETSVKISWNTNISSESQVEYGITGSYGGLSQKDSTLKTSHEHILTNLKASTVYLFRIRANREYSNPMSFKTLEESGAAPVITQQPSDQTVKEGSLSAITVEAQNVDSYQWQVFVRGEWIIPATNQQTKTLTLKTAPVDNGGTWRCALTNQFGTTYSESAKLNVISPTPVPPVVDSGELKAFPSAQGFGKYTTGGRGGRVIEVTNLQNSGAGSLRAAIDASGPRIIVFKVCGTIALDYALDIKNGDVTIAGQTACGGGIELVKNGMWITTSNVIIRNIRIRRYEGANFSVNAMNIGAFDGDVSNVIIDHVSVSWGADENFVVANGGNSYNTPNNYYVSNITIQKSITSQNNHLMLISSGTRRLSLYKNYFAFANWRAPAVSTPHQVNEITDYLRAELINNIIYDVGNIGLITFGLKASYIGNMYKRRNGGTQVYRYNLTPAGENTVDNQRPNTELYLKDNIDLNNSAPLDELSSVIVPYKVQAPSDTSKSVIEAANNSLALRILSDVGALPHDSNDSDIVARFISGSARPTYGKARADGFFEYDIILAQGNTYLDTDKDGMEDNWERNTFGDLSKSSNGDEDNDGYTNVEEYLNYLLP